MALGWTIEETLKLKSIITSSNDSVYMTWFQSGWSYEVWCNKISSLLHKCWRLTCEIGTLRMRYKSNVFFLKKSEYETFANLGCKWAGDSFISKNYDVMTHTYKHTHMYLSILLAIVLCIGHFTQDYNFDRFLIFHTILIKIILVYISSGLF